MQDPTPDHTNLSRIAAAHPPNEEATGAQEKLVLTVSSPSERTDSLSVPGKPTPKSRRTVDAIDDIEDPWIWTSNEQDRKFTSQESFGHSWQPASGRGLVRPELPMGDMPDYIKPFPSNIEAEDIQHLKMKGVLTLPHADLRDACLRCYFQNVQPIYPVVDPVKIVSLLDGTNKGNEKLSLLLLYALIFVGGTWIDVRLVRKLGFLSRKAFRKSIHRKMRLLYDADYENDRICLIQIFVLWTFWFEGPNENKDGWHWIGVALSLSRVIGLHQASSAADTNSATSRYRRRLWWSLATRDVICSFALSRCPRISDIDHNVTTLGIEDFEFHQMPDVLPGAVPQPLRQQRTFAHICVLYVKLVSIFGNICKAAYPESGSGKTSVLYSSQQLEGTDSISSNRNLSMTDQLKLFQRRLDEWRQAVPDDLWHTSSSLSNLKGAEGAERAHRGLLSMMYYATIMILHRPQVLSISSEIHPLDTSQKVMPDPSRTTVRFAARQITQIAMDFYEEDLVESLAATCITCLILASISHIFDMMLNEQTIQSEANQRLEQCKAIFNAFSEQQVGGQWALEVIEYILFRLKNQQNHYKVDIPITQTAMNSAVVKESQVSLAGNEAESPDRLQANRFPVSMDSSRDRATSELAGDGDALISGISTFPAFSMSRQPFSCNDSMLPSLPLDQPLPDNLMNFLGPELAWFEFPNTSENLDGMNWIGGGHV